jgi:hypothetical protein
MAFPRLSNPLSSLRDTQRVALYFLGFFLASGWLLWAPIREIFAGNAKLEQQFSFSPPSFLAGLGPSFVAPISIRFYALCILVGVLSGYALTLWLSKKQFVAGTVIDRLLIGLVVLVCLVRGSFMCFSILMFF